ncbi:MAG: hypothetical protein JWP29_5433, partial [Rhodoferax sp.]|nr:hypothetical protein [Rhodoferax sp.]
MPTPGFTGRATLQGANVNSYQIV